MRQGRTGEVIVITGASAGVGRALARRFARVGAKLALIARDRDALEQTRAELEALGTQAIACPADVADAEAVFAAARQAEERLGPVDIWVNDAMVTVFSPLADMTPEEFRRVTEVTYLGFVHGTMAALRHMRPRNRGQIVQVGSALAYRGIPLQSAYCGAKHAIQGFTESLRSELLHENSGIDITVVHLPAVNTPQFDWARAHMAREPRPAGPVYQPEAVADAIFHAVRRHERETWVGNSTAKAILGNMVAPGFLDSYLANTTIEGQQTAEPVSPDRKDNLFHPVPELHRARGSFGAEASDSVIGMAGGLVRLTVAMAGIAAIAAAGVLAGRALSGTGAAKNGAGHLSEVRRRHVS